MKKKVKNTVRNVNKVYTFALDILQDKEISGADLICTAFALFDYF